MLPIQTILHPTDFSKWSTSAFEVASSLARDQGARLIVMHVAGPMRAALFEGVPVVQQLEQHDKELEEQLHGLKPRDFNVPVDYRMEKGIPADEILRVARETKSDLIVLGTHGRTGLSRMLMGSVAEQVVRKAPCLVLAVKSPLSIEGASSQVASGQRSSHSHAC